MKNKDVLVIGGGISGMGTAHLLAQMGYQVHLLDNAPGIGGSFHLLDRTFPTNYCGICIMLPEQPSYCPTLEADMNPNIHILPYAELEALDGEAGDFTARIHHKPRYVVVEKCDACGLCAEVCPEFRAHKYEGDLAPQKAIYRPPLRAVPNAYVIDMDACTRCGACIEACPQGAIDLDMPPAHAEIPVGAVVLSPGFEPFDARRKGEFGWGHYPNVLTSIQFERLASLAGSTQARLKRPSDGKTPGKIAFIHCVGSRDKALGNDFCSSACCMYTAKQITMAKEIQPDLEVTVFTMDVRAFGKGFEPYMDRVMALPGVTYRRCMISAVYQYEQTKDVYVKYVNESGEFQEQDFDLIVLAVGLDHPAGAQELGAATGVALNQWQFAKTAPFAPQTASRPGVFIGGAFQEPMDIPETTAASAAAAAEVARLLGLPERPPAPAPVEERDISDEQPKLGVFVCGCGAQIAGAVDVETIRAHAASLPNVAFAGVVDDACRPENLDALRQTIQREGLNRVVIAGCTHRLYEDEFAGVMRAAGLNPTLLERANIREGAAWAFSGNGPGSLGPRTKGTATSVARSLVEMAATKALYHQAIKTENHPLQPRALVIGGGAAGMTAALALSDMGFPVDLVEKEADLGGNLRTSYFTVDGGDSQALLANLSGQIEAAGNVTVYTHTQVTEFSGAVGRYLAQLTPAGGEPLTKGYGAVIVASGGQPAPTTEYLYGQNDRVVTQKELEKALAAGAVDPAWKNVVMIQCVGSRDETHPWCSRVCCSHAIKNALKLKELAPETNVYVLYREVRTYGFMEAAYQQARDAGVAFLRYELPHKPEVTRSGDGLQIVASEPIVGGWVALQADLLVLSTGIEPGDNAALAGALNLPLDEDGFFQEDHPKMRPMDFTKAGIFMAGLAHSPRHIYESIAQAQGAAVRAAALLSKQNVAARSTRVAVNPRLCSFCGLCVEACPYNARVLDYDERVAQVLTDLCQGCGVCAMVCPNKATQQHSFHHKQMLATIDAALG
ncbi:MAG: FAD-dependent oxidoreductase [Chloroflexota bacterium]